MRLFRNAQFVGPPASGCAGGALLGALDWPSVSGIPAHPLHERYHVPASGSIVWGEVLANFIPGPQDRYVKIKQIIARRGWNQSKAAKHVGLAASDMSGILRGKIACFSLDRLESIILDLDMYFHTTVSPKQAASRRGHVSVELGPA